jgi:hypothetical protein
MANVTKIEKRHRSFIGQIIFLAFIGFNLLMLVWLVSGFLSVSAVPVENDVERVGLAIGAALGLGMVLLIWVIGAILLGIGVVVTRGDRIVVEEKTSPASSWFSSGEASAPAMDADAMIARYKQQQAKEPAPQRMPSQHMPSQRMPSQQTAPRAQFGKRGA